MHRITISRTYPASLFSKTETRAEGTINGVSFRAKVDFSANAGDGALLDIVTDFAPRAGFARHLHNDILDAVAVRLGVA